MLNEVCDSQEKGMWGKGSAHRGRVKSWYVRNAVICKPSIIKKRKAFA